MFTTESEVLAIDDAITHFEALICRLRVPQEHALFGGKFEMPLGVSRPFGIPAIVCLEVILTRGEDGGEVGRQMEESDDTIDDFIQVLAVVGCALCVKVECRAHLCIELVVVLNTRLYSRKFIWLRVVVKVTCPKLSNLLGGEVD